MIGTSEADWWRQAVVYQVYPRSFADADADGIGDLAGLTSRVPYLAELGVDAVWLSPFYPSGLFDGGYDVDDYREVDPQLGTLAGFDRLVDALHGHGIRLIVDIVPNHTSSRHPWFVEALSSAPGLGGPGPVRLPRRRRPGRRRTPLRLALALRRQRLDPAPGRAVVPAPVRRGAARPGLVES